MKKSIGSVVKGIMRDSVTTPPFCFEMRDRRGALIGGVCGITDNSQDRVSLILKKGESITVLGENMSCISYGNGSVEVSGRIVQITFCGGRDEKL